MGITKEEGDKNEALISIWDYFICDVFGEVLNAFIPLPIPASIYGLLLMLFCLCTKIIKLNQVKIAADFLLDIMPPMFIPAAWDLSWFGRNCSQFNTHSDNHCGYHRGCGWELLGGQPRGFCAGAEEGGRLDERLLCNSQYFGWQSASSVMVLACT